MNVFSHNIYVEGLLNSLAQALCRHGWISYFWPPLNKTGGSLLLFLDPFFVIINYIVVFFCRTPNFWHYQIYNVFFCWTPIFYIIKYITFFFPTTFMLRVSLTPWRKRFAVMAGFPLSAALQQTRGCCYCCLLDPSLLDPSPLPFKADILVCNAIFSTQWYLGCLLDPSPLALKGDLPLSNAIFTTQRSVAGWYFSSTTLLFVGPLSCGFQSRSSIL